MTRKDLDRFIFATYGVTEERLFAKNPTTAVYRHKQGRKWFAIIMEVSPRVLGLSAKEPIVIVNLKVDPILCDILRTKDGFFPAYHMNKEKWISAQICDQTDRDELFGLLAMSHRLTKTKKDLE